MFTTYHFDSASELSVDIIDAIKTAFKGKPIVLTVQEELDTTAYLLANEANRATIAKSLEQAANGEFIEISPDAL